MSRHMKDKTTNKKYGKTSQSSRVKSIVDERTYKCFPK